jgi:hypothetical protein
MKGPKGTCSAAPKTNVHGRRGVVPNASNAALVQAKAHDRSERIEPAKGRKRPGK